MTTETKIELAIQDLFAALDERATNKANSTAARLENRLASMEVRIEDLERDRENVAEEDTRAIIADMINDGDIRLHVD